MSKNSKYNNKNLAYQKAEEYAKFKHGEEYNDPVFERDVQETMNDFKAGFKTAMQIASQIINDKF